VNLPGTRAQERLGSRQGSELCIHPSSIILKNIVGREEGCRGEVNYVNLAELRKRLDAIDERLVALLSQRAQVIQEVADFKWRHHLPAYLPEREVAIIARLRAMNPGPLSDDALVRIYRILLEEMRNFEHEQIVSLERGDPALEKEE
jgi:chorismate mutase-like protein